MSDFTEFLTNLLGWPWTVFKRLNPLFKVVVIVFALAAWVPDPLDIIAVSVWGILAGVLFHGATATWIVVGLGVLFWVITQIIESLIVLAITTYLVPGIIGGIASLFDYDATSLLFED